MREVRPYRFLKSDTENFTATLKTLRVINISVQWVFKVLSLTKIQ